MYCSLFHCPTQLTDEGYTIEEVFSAKLKLTTGFRDAYFLCKLVSKYREWLFNLILMQC